MNTYNLINQYNNSCQFIFSQDSKNNFERMRTIFDNRNTSGIIFHFYLIPILNQEQHITDHENKTLLTLSKIIDRILRNNYIKMIEYPNNNEFLARNIRQENRMRRNFIRFLKHLNKDIHRELSSRESGIIRLLKPFNKDIQRVAK